MSNFFDYINKSEVSRRIFKSISPDLTAEKLSEIEFLEKGKSAQVGEVRMWGGKEYRKTVTGWVNTKGSKSSSSEEKESSIQNVNNETFKIKEDSSTPLSLRNLGGLVKVGEVKTGLISDPVYYKVKDKDNEVYEISPNYLSPSTPTDIDSLFAAVSRGELKPEEASDILNKLKEEVENKQELEETSIPKEKAYSTEELDNYAKQASDESLKRAGSSGNETLRVAAKKELLRRKEEGINKPKTSENPFEQEKK